MHIVLYRATYTHVNVLRVLRLQYARLFLDPRFLLFVLKIENKIKCGVISASMQWRHLGHLQLLSGALSPLTPVAQRGVCPRDEMANPPRIKVFTVERHGLLEDFVFFRTLSGVQSSPFVFALNRAVEYGPPQGQAPGGILYFWSALS